MLSILLNPLAFAVIGGLKPRLDRHDKRVAFANATTLPSAATDDEIPATTALTGHTILVGYGRVGSLVGEGLKAAGVPFLVIEDTDKALMQLRKMSIETIAGNAADPQILRAANIASAIRLIVAIPNAFEVVQIIKQAKAMRPEITIIARAHLDTEAIRVAELGADIVVADAEESARGILKHVVEVSS